MICMKKKSNIVLKVIVLVICLLVFIFLINIGRKMYLIANIQEKASKLGEKENYSWNWKMENKEITTYRKGEKAIIIMDTENAKVIFAKNGNLVNTYTENSNGKMARLNQEEELYNIIKLPNIISKKNVSMFDVVNSKISSESIEGKECYLIESSSEAFISHTSVDKVQIFIEKETGLPIKVVEYDDKNEKKTANYKYDFDKTTDENLVEPNISEYKIEKQ